MFFHSSPQRRFRRVHVHRRYRPRGVAVVIVLGLLAVTLAISYATLRGQGTSSQLARNSSRALDARVASQSGLAAALRKISENGWTGVGTPLSSNVTNHSWYQVTFATGDGNLSTTDPLYGEFPYRLTIESTGTASDPSNAAVKAEHKSRCVVQLVRKKLVTEPANWSTLTGKIVYQYGSPDVYVQFPVRINGPVEFHGRLIFCNQYPNNASALNLYLSDLNARRIAGLGDDRPFPSTMTLRNVATLQDAATVSNLTTRLGMSLTDTAASTDAPLNHPGNVATYKLYPGGKEYNVPVLQTAYGNPIVNQTITPDPLTNPLGIYRSVGALSLQSNAKITGTIITEGSGEFQVFGTGVELKSFSLPSLYGSASVYQLPAAMVFDDLRMNSASDVKINGMTMVWDEFEIKTGGAGSKFAFTGNLITKALQLRGRSTWTLTPAQWNTDRLLFQGQLAAANPIPYFPDFEQSLRTFTVKPALTFSPDSSGVTPHWHDWSQAVYQPDPADGGLRWEVVRWEDSL